jgi:hypothetical protein
METRADIIKEVAIQNKMRLISIVLGRVDME